MMMMLSFVITCLVSLRALRLRTLVIHSIIVIHSSPHCVDARFALASLALLTYAKPVSDMYWSAGITGNGTGLVCVAWTIPSPLVLDNVNSSCSGSVDIYAQREWHCIARWSAVIHCWFYSFYFSDSVAVTLSDYLGLCRR